MKFPFKRWFCLGLSYAPQSVNLNVFCFFLTDDGTIENKKNCIFSRNMDGDGVYFGKGYLFNAKKDTIEFLIIPSEIPKHVKYISFIAQKADQPCEISYRFFTNTQESPEEKILVPAKEDGISAQKIVQLNRCENYWMLDPEAQDIFSQFSKFSHLL